MDISKRVLLYGFLASTLISCKPKTTVPLTVVTSSNHHQLELRNDGSIVFGLDSELLQELFDEQFIEPRVPIYDIAITHENASSFSSSYKKEFVFEKQNLENNIVQVLDGIDKVFSGEDKENNSVNNSLKTLYYLAHAKRLSTTEKFVRSYEFIGKGGRSMLNRSGSSFSTSLNRVAVYYSLLTYFGYDVTYSMGYKEQDGKRLPHAWINANISDSSISLDPTFYPGFFVPLHLRTKDVHHLNNEQVKGLGSIHYDDDCSYSTELKNVSLDKMI